MSKTDVIKFNENDFKSIAQIFLLARVQIVNNDPENVKALASVINYEEDLKNKMAQFQEVESTKTAAPTAKKKSKQNKKSELEQA